jgi:hypothetical protein
MMMILQRGQKVLEESHILEENESGRKTDIETQKSCEA